MPAKQLLLQVVIINGSDLAIIRREYEISGQHSSHGGGTAGIYFPHLGPVIAQSKLNAQSRHSIEGQKNVVKRVVCTERQRQQYDPPPWIQFQHSSPAKG